MLSSRSALRRASAVHSGSIPCVPVREYASAEAETTPLRCMTPILPPAPILPSVPITATTPTTNITHMTTTATTIPKTILAVLDMATPLPNYPGERLPSAHFPVSYTHLRAHETVLDLVCRLLLEKKKKKNKTKYIYY